MAEKLSIQIALEGGKEIERQLEGIGDAGQKAFEEIAKAAEKVGGFKNLKPEEVTQKLRQMGVEGTAAFGKIQTAVANAARMETVVVAIQGVENALGKVVNGVLGFARAFGGLGVAITLINKIREGLDATAEAVNKVNTAALGLGLTIEKFDELRLGMEKAGLSAKAISDGVAKFASQLDKLNVSNVTKAFSELEEAAKRGFGAQGTLQLQLLEKEAKKIGPAGDAARQALEKLGLPIPDGAKTGLKDLDIEFGKVSQRLPEFLEKLKQMPDGAERTKLAFQELGPTLGAEVIKNLQAGGTAFDEMATKLQGLTSEGAKAATEWENTLNRQKAAADRFIADPSWQNFTGLMSAAMTRLSTEFKSLGDSISSLGGGVWTAFQTAGEAALNAIRNLMQGLIADLEKAYDLLKKIFAADAPDVKVEGAGAAGLLPGMARGGPVGGRGSGTSDSNLAWVSRGEHIMPAGAVRQPGVLALLEALRRSGGNLRHVLDRMGGFAAGGLVPRSVPAFATGGLVGNRDLGTLTLQLGGQSVRVLASPSAVEQLSRFATVSGQRRAGRRPGWA